MAEPETERPDSVVVPKPILETDRTVVEAEFDISRALPVEDPQIVKLAYGVDVPTDSCPVLVIVVVPVAPNAAPLADSRVDEAPPLNVCRAVHTLAVAMLSESVPDTPPTNDPSVPEYDSPDRVGVDVATVEWNPFDPMKATPWVRFEKKTLLLNVDEAVENRPFRNPMAVVVEL